MGHVCNEEDTYAPTRKDNVRALHHEDIRVVWRLLVVWV